MIDNIYLITDEIDIDSEACKYMLSKFPGLMEDCFHVSHIERLINIHYIPKSLVPEEYHYLYSDNNQLENWGNIRRNPFARIPRGEILPLQIGDGLGLLAIYNELF